MLKCGRREITKEGQQHGKGQNENLGNVNNNYSMSGRCICMTGEILDIYDDLCYIYLSLRTTTTTTTTTPHGLIHDPQPKF